MLMMTEEGAGMYQRDVGSPVNAASTADGRDERGVVAVWIAFCLTVFLGVAALVFDVGELFVTRSELQNAADAAAVAAAAQLPDQGAACGAATAIAPPNHDGNSGILGCGDLTFGSFDDASGTFTIGGSPTNAVRARTHRTGANDVRHIFASVLGNDSSPVEASATAYQANATIDFEGLAPGDETVTVSSGAGISGDPIDGSVTVTANGRSGHGAMIFDGTCGGSQADCSGNPPDFDLYVPAQGNILIISEDGDHEEPNDDRLGGTIVLDFSGLGRGTGITVTSMKVIDGDENNIPVRLYQAGNPAPVASGSVRSAPDGSTVTVSFFNGTGEPLSSVTNIVRMEVDFPGSGAIDDIGAASVVSLVE